MPLRFLVGISILVSVLSAEVVSGQGFPNKPLRMVTGQPGGSLDYSARVIASELAAIWGQQVVVDNRGFVLAPRIVAQAAPDGYTMLFFGNPFWLAPLMQARVEFDPVKDFAPVTMAVSSPNVLVVNPSVPAKSVKELIAFAKANPGKLNYASSSIGSADHLAAELFKSMTGVNIVSVPYKGASQAVTAVIANEVQLEFINAATGIPHIKSGRLRALAVGTPKPSSLFPGLPTIAASGLPGYTATTDLAIFVPAGTPAVTINRLNLDIVRALNTPDAKEKLSRRGLEILGSTPQELEAGMKYRIEVAGKLIKEAGIGAR